jgi:CHAT domain-containing protein/tetratricopeptide (TPR) repeat protein
MRLSALRVATPSVRLLVFLGALLIGSLAASAQQPSRELQNLQDTTRDLYQAGDRAEALRLAERALPLVVREYGAGHEQMGVHTYTLGMLNETLGDFTAAERYFAQSVRIRENVYGPESAGVAMALENLAGVQIKAGRIDAAEPNVRRALKIRQDLLGSNHAFAAPGHASLGDVSLARGDWPAALASYREAIRLLMAQDTSQAVVKSIVDEDIKRHRETFVGLCRAAWATGSQSSAPNTAPMFEETFVAAQQAWTTSAAAALAKMSARIGAGNTELGRRIREVQDLSARVLELHSDDTKMLGEWSAVQRRDPAYSAALEEFRAASIARSRDQAPNLKRQKELVEELTSLLQRCPPGQNKAGCEGSTRQRETITKELGELSKATSAGAGDIMAIHARMEAAEKALPGYAEFTSRRTALRDAIDRAESEARSARTRIVRAFPDYAALADPKPLAVIDARALLGRDEALVTILVGAGKSYVWALTREKAQWAEIDAGSKTLADEVTALRQTLDPLAQQDAEGAPGSRPGVWPGFDLRRAHALYRLVLGPVEDALAGKQHIILVPTGPLTSLPFQVLVTRPPQASSSFAADAMRGADWLIKSYALSVLPSVSSLNALRKLPAGNTAPKPFFGMGDPILQGPDPSDRQRSASRSGTLPARFYRNGLADVRAVRALTPLPETAEELNKIAATLGAGPGAINVRENATEAKVKAAALDEYRVIQFATHGLIAGDLSDLAEPALVLTPPDQPTEANDGLLTASEIAALKLNADWVVLSACNTAAGAGEGAEALSGLARAFFYAGARALLVSHWAVYSTAATELTTKTFANLAATPNMGRAEAFRRAMLDLIAQGRPPSYWAPFVVVGEGGAAR